MCVHAYIYTYIHGLGLRDWCIGFRSSRAECLRSWFCLRLKATFLLKCITFLVQQQHCLRNHWFKKLSPSDSRSTQKYVHKMRAFKIRNPGYPGLGVPISYFALSHFLSSLVLFAQKRKPRNQGSRFRIPKARRQTLTKETKK